MDNSFDQLIKISEELQPHLREYLLEQGVSINSNGFFSCIHPDHPDHHPSAHIVDNGVGKDKIFYCFSCLTCGNITLAAHFLEGKPVTGIGFFEDTLPYLCKKYNIEYEPIRISNEARDIYQKRSAVRDAVNIVHASAYKDGELNIEHPAIKHLIDRGISDKTIREFKIGCIDKFSDYIDKMIQSGYKDREWLDRVDLANRGIFSDTGIIIPILDEKASPVGFVTRATGNMKGIPKYRNSVNSDIYHKSEILFNFHNYRKENGPLWIVEGYLDAVILQQYGLLNVCALGSTVLTEQHVDMLAQMGVKSIILCLDSDDGGNAGIKLAIERLGAYQTFKSIRIIELPKDDDPDSFVRREGLEKLEELANPEVALSPFSWTLKQATFEDDPLVIVEQAIPTIASEDSNIKRLKMIRELSNLTGIDRNDIRKDVEALVNKDSGIFLEELTDINKYVQTALSRKKIKDTKNILQESLIKIRNLETKFNNTVDNRVTFEEKRAAQWEKIENGIYNFGLKCNKFKRIEEQLDGLPFTTCLTCVGGRPSSGKTTLLSSLAVDIVESNEDAAVFFMSIDDTVDLMTLKMLAQKSGFATSKIKKFKQLDADEQLTIRSSYQWLEELSSRFIMVDASEGTSPENLEAHIEWFCREYKDYKRLFILDNFHKLTVPVTAKKVDSVSLLSEKVKEMTRLYDLHIMMTVELRKMIDTNARPTPNDMKDTVQLEYDSDMIFMVHNELQVKGEDKTNIHWLGMYGDEGEVPMPYLEVLLHKNKITGKRGGMAYKLNTYNLQVTEDSWSTIKTLNAKNAANKNNIFSSRTSY